METTRPRNPASLLLALGALGAAIAAVGLTARRKGVAEDAQRSATRTAAIVEEGIAALERDLGREVGEAAGLRALRAAVDQGIDAATLVDVLATEDWWGPYRARLALIVVEGRKLGARGDRAEALEDARLLARARGAEAATARLADKTGPMLAAAAGVKTNRAGAGVLVLGRPIDESTLETLALKAAAALLVSDGRAAGRFAGALERRSALSGLVGRERERIVLDEDAGYVAVAAPVGPSHWIWAAYDLRGGAGPTWVAVGACWALGAFMVVAAALSARQARRRRLTLEGPIGEPAPSTLGPYAPAAPAMTPPAPAPAPAIALPPAASPPELGAGAPVATPAPVTPPPVVAPPPVAPHAPTAPLDVPPSVRDATTRISGGTTMPFGRYSLLERIGEGGMAEIFTAVLSGAEGFHRLYVIKRLKPELMRNKVAVDQFIDEARLGAQLQHSNIVSILDFGQVANGYFIAQDYIVGRNLGQILEAQRERGARSLEPSLVFYIAHEILDALTYAHEKTNDDGVPLGIVHRDVSSSNIMVTETGEVKLLDFGIVKAVDRVSKTEFGHVKGNATFMSPEQARAQPVDGRSDLFSLGLVMFHTLTGETLYAGQTMAEMLYQAATGPTAEHVARIRALPPPTGALIERVLALHPDGRYASARDFAGALPAYASGAKKEMAALMRTLFGEALRRQNLQVRSRLAKTLSVT